ncbi:MAG: sugar isomerase [Saprospiraceae bacterium]|nr:sugar isomerase [Saprospiraceae bacterium]
MKSSFISQASYLFVCLFLVNVGNYLLNLVLGRLLGPEIFAEVSILSTVVLIISFIALAFQLSSTKHTAKILSTDKSLLPDAAKWFREKSKTSGVVILILLGLTFIPVTDYLNLQSPVSYLLIIGGIPAYLIMSVNRGILQGSDNIRKLGMSYIIEMLVRVLVSLSLITLCFVSGIEYYSEAVGLGFLLSFLAVYYFSRDTKTSTEHQEERTFDSKEIVAFMVIVGFYELSQILINNSDLILVKHYFSNYEAGLYASLSLIGRVVFFATWSVVGILIPRVVQLRMQNKDHQGVFMQALGIVFSVAILITATCFFFDKLIIQLAFGEEYVAMAHLLWKYAACTTLFTCANVFSYYYMSLDKYLPVVLSLGGGVLQIVLIIIFHRSVSLVIQMQLIAMGILLISMLIYHFKNVYNNEKIKISNRISLSTR